ncbi:MAG TPA: hypothetical protein VN282_05995 [Pyrinomonadaceae bacterium]|nr:hypothetical protein [Pyrinomonadaceae bacterium]
MKNCPRCNAAHPDSLNNCPNDGSILVAQKKKRGVLRLALIGVACFSLLVLGGCGVVGFFVLRQPADPARDRAAAERNGAALDKVTSQLAGVTKSFPEASALSEAPCTDGGLEQAAAEGKAQVVFAEYDQLARFAGASAAQKDWEWATAEAVRELKPRAQVTEPLHSYRVTSAIKEVYDPSKRHYLVVFRATRKQLPVKQIGGFSSGYYDGWAVLYDLDSGRRLCGQRLQAESSDSVRRRRGSDADAALLNDFQDRFKEAAEAAVKRMNPKLDLRM